MDCFTYRHARDCATKHAHDNNVRVLRSRPWAGYLDLQARHDTLQYGLHLLQQCVLSRNIQDRKRARDRQVQARRGVMPKPYPYIFVVLSR